MPEPAPLTVIIPCFRCRETIERAVSSVAAQTWLPQAVILVDDASGDGTSDMLHGLTGRYPRGWITVLEQAENGGPGVARNVGWAQARTPYIGFLDADDAWHPRKVELQLAWMQAHPDAAFTGTRSRVCLQEKWDWPIDDRFAVREISFHRLLVVSLLPTRSVIIRSDVPLRFVPGKRYSEDYLLWLLLLAEGYRGFLIDAPLGVSFKKDFGVSGLSSHLWLMHAEVVDTYRQVREAGYIGTLQYWGLRVIEQLKFLRRLILSM